MNGFENIESFPIVEKVENLSSEALPDSTWEYSDAKYENLPENLKDCSFNLIDQYLEKLERVHDCDVVEEIASKLKGLEDLKYEKWIEMSENQKLELLNEIESSQAEIQHRDKMTVEFENLPKGTFGYQDAYTQRIVLNRAYVMSDHPFYHRESVVTILHEGRHAYQHYNVDVKTIHESDAEVASWRENFYDPKYGYYQSQDLKMYIPLRDGTTHVMSDRRLYEYQPVEIDARNFASDVIKKLESYGIFGAGSHL